MPGGVHCLTEQSSLQVKTITAANRSLAANVRVGLCRYMCMRVLLFREISTSCTTPTHLL